MNSSWLDSAGLLGQAADNAAKNAGVPWLLLGIAAAVFILPFVLGTLLGWLLRLKNLSFKFGVVLFSIFFSLAPFVFQQLTNEKLGWTAAIRLGIDLAGGTNLVYQIDEKAAKADGKPVDTKTLDKMVEAIGKRINPSGAEEVTVRRVGTNRFEVIIPGADQDMVRQTKRNITELGTLEFAILANERDHATIIKEARLLEESVNELHRDGRVIASWRQVDPKEGSLDIGNSVIAERKVPRLNAEGEKADVMQYLVLHDAKNDEVTGEYLLSTRSTIDPEKGLAVSFTLNSTGSVRFARLTTKNQPSPDGFERRLAILLNGFIHSAPNINERITGGSVQISGSFTQSEVDALISVLDAGALEIPLIKEPVSEFTISPLLGVDVKTKGVTAIIVSAAAVFIFMAVYYLAAGLIADLCLLLNLVLVVGAMALISATFTLPGLAGLVLTIGMAVDSNVLIYERMREELHRGASLRMAIENGFSKAFSAIFDGNVTTLITAVILYMIGTDQIKGFAVSLFIGLSMSLFSVLYFGHLCFTVAERKRWITRLEMMKFVGETHIDFLSYRWIAFTASGLLILAGLASLYFRGKDNLDIDFTGGTMVMIEFTEQQDTDDVKLRLKEAFAETPVSLEQLTLATDDESSSGRRFRIRTVVDNQKEVTAKLNQAFSESGHQLRKVTLSAKPAEAVPEKLAEDVAKKADPARFTAGHMVRMNFSGQIAESTVLDSWAETLKDMTDGDKSKYETPEALLAVAGVSGGNGKTDEDARYTDFVGFATRDVSAEDVDASIKALEAKRASESLFDEINTFDTSVGNETQQRAAIAIIASLVVIVIYMWFRFEKVYYGLAAVAALAHDVLVTLGSIALGAYLSRTPLLEQILLLEDFKVNMGLIASLLTIVGYSLNDTIVIFDRIREVKGKNPNITYDMINLCVNQTLSRTILTSTTVLLVVLILYIFGGAGIHVFAYSMIIGTITGCYSTVYIANPVLLWLVTRAKVGPAPAAPPKAVPA